MSRRFRLLLLSSALFAAEAHCLEVMFLLAPVEAFAARGPQSDSYLYEGTVYLYRAGEYVPGLVVPANEPRRIDIGTWHWIAEAPGHVSVDTGTLVNLEENDLYKTMSWPVVPACTIVLDEAVSWRGVVRLDVASPRFGATYPAIPATRRSLNVPAGEEPIAYSVGHRGLIGASRITGCEPGTVVSLAPPAPPASDRQHLLVQVHLPEGTAPDELHVHFDAAGEPTSPTAVVWTGRRGSFFFLDLPADRPGRVRLEHPKLRGRELPVAAEGGSFRELPQVEMSRRSRTVSTY